MRVVVYFGQAREILNAVQVPIEQSRERFAGIEGSPDHPKRGERFRVRQQDTAQRQRYWQRTAAIGSILNARLAGK